jgi:hypothetical protein
MWYKAAQSYNIYGLPTSSGKPKVKTFSDSDSELDINQDLPNNAEDQIPDVQPEEEVTVDDPDGDGFFSPEDLQSNIKLLEVDPTANIELPPLHSDPDPHCYCTIESRPILSQPGANDARRVWIVNHYNNETGRPINNCPKCTASAEDFNQKELQRLRNKGINID